MKKLSLTTEFQVLKLTPQKENQEIGRETVDYYLVDHSSSEGATVATNSFSIKTKYFKFHDRTRKETRTASNHDIYP